MENLSSNLNHGNVISKLLVTLSGKAKLSIASCTVYEAMDWSSPLSLPCHHGREGSLLDLSNSHIKYTIQRVLTIGLSIILSYNASESRLFLLYKLIIFPPNGIVMISFNLANGLLKLIHILHIVQILSSKDLERFALTEFCFKYVLFK